MGLTADVKEATACITHVIDCVFANEASADRSVGVRVYRPELPGTVTE